MRTASRHSFLELVDAGGLVLFERFEGGLELAGEVARVAAEPFQCPVGGFAFVFSVFDGFGLSIEDASFAPLSFGEFADEEFFGRGTGLVLFYVGFMDLFEISLSSWGRVSMSGEDVVFAGVLGGTGATCVGPGASSVSCLR